MDDIADYDFELPDELIARRPPERRDGGRLLVLDRSTGRIEHRAVTELPQLLARGDRLVLNDTRVLPARLLGHRSATGGKWEGLYLGCDDAGVWEIIGQCRGKLQPGERIAVALPSGAVGFELELLERGAGGSWTARPVCGTDAPTLLDRCGRMPLPPYLEREADEQDVTRYQTVYAERPGAVAAPTAGLHLTDEILSRCSKLGIERSSVTLHVGLGTFRPVSTNRLSEHRMHAEWCELPDRTAEELAATRQDGGRIVGVGTTTVRTLESAAVRGRHGERWSGETDLFIRPPYEFRAVDALLTNFHLPKSTLLVLVCTFAGREPMLEAYREAVRERYRFFSYGDAMLIL